MNELGSRASSSRSSICSQSTVKNVRSLTPELYEKRDPKEIDRMLDQLKLDMEKEEQQKNMKSTPLIPNNKSSGSLMPNPFYKETPKNKGAVPKQPYRKKFSDNAWGGDLEDSDDNHFEPESRPQKAKAIVDGKTRRREDRSEQRSMYQEPPKTDTIAEALHTLTRVMMRQNVEPLPKFDGNFEAWPVFIAQYNATKRHFDDEGNLARLRRSLTDRALKLVKNQLAFSLDPDVVIDKLKENFGRQDGTIRDVVNKIRQITIPDSQNSASLLKFKEELEDGYAVLVSLNAEGYLRSPTIVDDILARCPRDMRKNWGNFAYEQRHLRPGEAILEDFLDWIKKFTKWIMWDADARKRAPPTRTSTKEPERQTKPVFVQEEIHRTGESDSPSHVISTNEKSQVPSCLACGKEGHRVAACKQFMGWAVNRRWELAKKKRLCFMCLDRMHKSECPKKKRCGRENCEKFHHHLLHKDPAKAEETDKKSDESKADDKHEKSSDKSEKLHATIKNPASQTHFKIVPIKLYGRDEKGREKVIECNAFLDDGSSLSMISNEIAEMLNLQGPIEELCLGWTDGSSKTIEKSRNVSLGISSLFGGGKYIMQRVRTVFELNLPVPKIQVKELKEKYSHLEQLDIPQPFQQKPGILIGEEHAHIMATLDMREGPVSAPIAIKTRIGWLLHGRNAFAENGDNEPRLCSFMCECKTDKELNTLMSDFFAQENPKPNVTKIESKETQRAVAILQKTLVFKENRCEVGLLWKNDNTQLPDSKQMALRRLECLRNKMRKDPEYAMLFTRKMKENLDKGYLRRLSPEEELVRTDKTFYLPIFGVTSPHKPGKIRIVYDAAAKVNGISLNDNLLKGPDLLNSLCGVLWRSREYEFLVSGDIEEMYHRILLRKEDQDAQRILWHNEKGEVETLVLSVKSFGACDSPSSAEFVKNENADRFKESHPEAVKIITGDHFVDNMLKSFANEDTAMKQSQDVKAIHAAGGFRMRGWVSNSQKTMNYLNGDESSVESMSLIMDKEMTEKILGLYWHVESDTLGFKLNFVKVDPEILSAERIPTKREVLKLLMSIYDPHGFVMPVVSRGRMLMQDIWRYGHEWDDHIAPELFAKWQIWLSEMRKIADVKIPRCLSTRIPCASTIELHTFVDASEMAACAVSYLKIAYENGIDVAFIGSKCKTAPKNYISVPRLELEACWLGARLANNVLKELTIKINRKYFHSDSKTALSWIRSDHRKYKPYVASRVSSILDVSTVTEWMWIAGKENVADEGTKWDCKVDLKPESRWFSGPPLLQKHSEETLITEEIPETEEELRSAFVGSHQIFTGLELYSYMNFKKYSSWARMVRVVAWHMRFVRTAERIGKLRRERTGLRKVELQKIKADVANRKVPKKHWLEAKWRCQVDFKEIPPLSPDELQAAETFIFRKIQWEAWREEVKAVKLGNKVNGCSKLKMLSPYFDYEMQLLRLKGRIDAAPYVSVDFKRPILLDRSHYLTRLLVMQYHKDLLHKNHETVANMLRQRFHVPQLRVLIKSVVKDCQDCKNKRATPQNPEMSPLPFERLQVFEKPFSYTGMDYFGPLIVTVGRHHEKRWGVLFTCLVTRGVHVELAASLNTDSCIMSVRNFMSRRGVVKTMYSDNGTNMKGAEAELGRAIAELDQARLQNEGQHPLPGETVTKWKFITPRAPHHGGAWERLVKSVKTVLYATLKERHPKEEILRNLLIEAENVVNSRPLTYQEIDPETMEAITPNHLLQLSGKVLYAPGEFEKEEYGKRQWRFSQQLIDEFWKRFVHSVLPEMRRRSKWFEDQRPIELNDIVLLMEENLPRNCWPKGKVSKLHPGVDGKCRSVTVQTNMGTYKRPVTKVIVLDVKKKEVSDSS